VIVLVTYDVSTQDKAGRRRLRHVARACKDNGQRVQYSVFECRLTKTQWTSLRQRLLDAMDPEQDSLRFYFIDEDAAAKTEHHGCRAPVDLEGPLFA
jgi:CRISPR-associated protein Cas2